MRPEDLGLNDRPRPPTIRGDDAIGPEVDRGGENERVRQPQLATVTSAELGRARGDLPGDRLNSCGEVGEEPIHGAHRLSVTASGADQAFGVSGCWYRQRVPPIDRRGDGNAGRIMVSIIGVEHADHHAGVQDGQRHSSRS